MYSIDLATLLGLLLEFRKSGILYAELPPGVNGEKEHCYAWLDLAMGKVLSCYIKNNRGQSLLAGNEALDVLYDLGVLDWTLNARQDTPAATSSRTPAAPRSPIPRRVAQVTPFALNSWPRLHRRVFVLIDGEKNASKIASMLSLSSPQGLKQVMEVLYELRAMGLITMV